MALRNDTRGWIMACVSGVACVSGSAIIFVDLAINCIPRYKDFRIQDNNAFLSASLSLSFGVMLFSALYSMLPSSKDYLVKSGLAPNIAAYALVGCFLGGVIGIQIVSRFLHHYIPSHIVDCDHTHQEPGGNGERVDLHQPHHEQITAGRDDYASEDTPLLSQGDLKPRIEQRSQSWTVGRTDTPPDSSKMPKRPSLQSTLTRRVTTLVSAAKAHCDEGGPCYGFTDPCGKECFKVFSRSPSSAMARRTTNGQFHRPSLQSPSYPPLYSSRGQLEGLDEESEGELTEPGEGQQNSTSIRGQRSRQYPSIHSLPIRDFLVSGEPARSHSKTRSSSEDVQNQFHHHHVPSNAFLSIGLQTSIAIALHKLPEGFITYATNHVNPKLGFTVFMALFIHNIAEGFAMALPLYLAFGSRLKAMLLSSALGGASQPLGAALAVLWFKTANTRDMERVYGCMFAATSGILTSVALNLFSESLQLTHNRNLCMTFAFVGMGILGISYALTA